MNVEILYKDRDMLICKKPAGVPSQPDSTGQEDLLSALAKTYSSVKLIHRLDTPTGGVMVFGLIPKATAKLCAMVQDHELFRKEYLAVLPASPEEDKGTFQDYLYHDKRVNKAFVAGSARKGSKEAVLDYRVLAKAQDGHTLVLVRLHTGRTHQIRVQFASRGLPLVGDGKYGSREKCPYIGLWAYRLTFTHPTKNTTVSFSVEPDKTLDPWSCFEDSINSDK